MWKSLLGCGGATAATPQQVCAYAVPQDRELMCTEIDYQEPIRVPSVTH